MEGLCKNGAPRRQVSHEIPSFTHRVQLRSTDKNIRTKIVNIRH